MFVAMFNGWYFFWLTVPARVLVTPLAFLIMLPLDFKSLKADVKKLIPKAKKEKV